MVEGAGGGTPRPKYNPARHNSFGPEFIEGIENFDLKTGTLEKQEGHLAFLCSICWTCQSRNDATLLSHRSARGLRVAAPPRGGPPPPNTVRLGWPP